MVSILVIMGHLNKPASILAPQITLLSRTLYQLVPVFQYVCSCNIEYGNQCTVSSNVNINAAYKLTLLRNLIHVNVYSLDPLVINLKKKMSTFLESAVAPDEQSPGPGVHV